MQRLEFVKQVEKETRYWKYLPDYLTDVMKKHGPKETTYATEIEEKDLYWLRRYFEKVKDRDNAVEVQEYFKQNERLWNDHKIAYVEIDGRRIYLTKTSKGSDVPTIQGITFCMRLILGEAVSPWKYMAIGSDTREARAYQQMMYAEVGPRMDMTNVAQGLMVRFDWTMEFVGIFPSTHPTVTVNECGVSNVTDNTGTFLNRNVFKDVPIAHVINVLPFTVATSLAFVSVLTWEFPLI